MKLSLLFNLLYRMFQYLLLSYLSRESSHSEQEIKTLPVQKKIKFNLKNFIKKYFHF